MFENLDHQEVSSTFFLFFSNYLIGFSTKRSKEKSRLVYNTGTKNKNKKIDKLCEEH